MPSHQMVMELLQYSTLSRPAELLVSTYQARSRPTANAHMERTLERLLQTHCVPLKVEVSVML